MENRNSLNYSVQEGESITPRNGDFGFGTSDRRYAYSRQPSFHQSQEPQTPISRISNEFIKPFLSRTVSSIDMPPGVYSFDENEKAFGERKVSVEKLSVLSIFQAIRTGNKSMKKLFALISLNVAYSTAELAIGLFTGRIGLVSDAFHLTFGCGILTFSLFTMAASRKKSDHAYTYGQENIVLAIFVVRPSICLGTKGLKFCQLLPMLQLFLLFLSFSIAVEALHAFIQDESEHKHYLIFSAVTNLLVNVIGVWFFRSYARINLVYRKSEDLNYHSVCLHVLADSIRSAGLILASWFLSLGVENAEVLCLGLVSVAIFMLVMPLFKTTGGILLQMSPPSIPPSALSKCLRQITAREDVTDVTQARFWELVPGHVVGSLSIQVKGTDDRLVLQFVHSLYHDLGIKELTVQTDSD